MPHIKHIPLNTLIAVDQLANVLCGGWPDETLSSRAWRLHNTGRGWALARKAIDGLFFWQKGHCEGAYKSEVARNHLPPQQRMDGGQGEEAENGHS